MKPVLSGILGLNSLLIEEDVSSCVLSPNEITFLLSKVMSMIFLSHCQQFFYFLKKGEKVGLAVVLSPGESEIK